MTICYPLRGFWLCHSFLIRWFELWLSFGIKYQAIGALQPHTPILQMRFLINTSKNSHASILLRLPVRSGVHYPRFLPSCWLHSLPPKARDISSQSGNQTEPKFRHEVLLNLANCYCHGGVRHMAKSIGQSFEPNFSAAMWLMCRGRIKDNGAGYPHDSSNHNKTSPALDMLSRN